MGEVARVSQWSTIGAGRIRCEPAWPSRSDEQLHCRIVSIGRVHLRGHMKMQSNRIVETIVPHAAAIADQEPEEKERKSI